MFEVFGVIPGQGSQTDEGEKRARSRPVLSILLYSILFYSILFYPILFYYIILYYILFFLFYNLILHWFLWFGGRRDGRRQQLRGMEMAKGLET